MAQPLQKAFFRHDHGLVLRQGLRFVQAIIEQGFHRFTDVVTSVQARFQIGFFSIRYMAQNVFAAKVAGTDESERIPASPITSPGPMRPDSNGLP